MPTVTDEARIAFEQYDEALRKLLDAEADLHRGAADEEHVDFLRAKAAEAKREWEEVEAGQVAHQ